MGEQVVSSFDVLRKAQVILAMTPSLELVCRSSHLPSWRIVLLNSSHLGVTPFIPRLELLFRTPAAVNSSW